MAYDEQYMQRCLQLALLGQGYVAPNPMVGAVLVHDDVIIGEGYHKRYGEAHAEVNCVNSVEETNRHLISQSTMYVSLEPCAHFGKTPPCADLIIANKIPRVVIGCMDNYLEVNGRGIEKLRNADIEVTVGVLENEAKKVNQRFFTYHQQQRPYITLKWAQSNDGKIAKEDYSKVYISNEYSNRLVHKWRSEEPAIMVGTNTALHDNPSLTTRLWKGENPVRIVLDKELKVPAAHYLLAGNIPTIIFNNKKDAQEGSNQYIQLNNDKAILKQMLDKLYQLKIQSVMVEGGTKLLQSFIEASAWDEARVITNNKLIIGDGIHAPALKNHQLIKQEELLDDSICYYGQRN